MKQYKFLFKFRSGLFHIFELFSDYYAVMQLPNDQYVPYVESTGYDTLFFGPPAKH